MIRFSDFVEINPKVNIKKNEEHPFIDMKNVIPGNRFIYSQVNRLYSGNGSKFQNNDVLFARITPCLENGKIAQYKSIELKPSFGSTEFFVFRAKVNIINSSYLYYLCLSPLVRKTAEKSMTGASGRQRASLKSIKDIEIKIPNMITQKKIASILSAYDDLIENNNRRIDILEEMAHGIYKEWFVHFRFPGHEKVKMIDSELGKIPEEWTVEKLSSVVAFIKGIEPGSKNYLDKKIENTIPFLRVGDFNTRISKIWIYKEMAKDRVLSKKDIALTLDGTPGIVRIGNYGAYSSGIQKVNIRGNQKITWAFLYLLLNSNQIQNTIKAHSIGTTILHAGSSKKYMKFLKPNSNIVFNFEKNISPFLELKLILEDINKYLTETRDFLLPKLLSGKIDVSDLDINIEDIK